MTDIYGSVTNDEPKKKTRLSENFTVTDAHRRYCAERWGYGYIADTWLEDFREVFETNGTRHVNWDRTFCNFIRRSSPSGPFYHARYWQAKMDAARRMEHKEREKDRPAYHPRQIAPRTDPVTAHSLVEAMRKRLTA